MTVSSNNLVGTPAIGTLGNVSYITHRAMYVDFKNCSLANVLNNTTSVIAYSSAMFRIPGQNNPANNLTFPKKITVSGSGEGGVRGAWLIIGNSEGTFNANLILAGDGTLMTSSSGGGNYNYTETGTISGSGNLRLVNDTTYTTFPTLALSGSRDT
jgi:hypothetical protein